MEYVTARQAQEMLGVSKVKMAQLIRDGILPAETNPLDRRQLLIPSQAVEDLRQRVGRQD